MRIGIKVFWGRWVPICGFLVAGILVDDAIPFRPGGIGYPGRHFRNWAGESL